MGTKLVMRGVVPMLPLNCNRKECVMGRDQGDSKRL